MSATEQYSSPSSNKMRLMAQLKAWRDAEENPLGEDGKPLPLRMVVLKVSNNDTPLIPGIPINAKTELPVIADKILRKMKDWANSTSANGEDIHGDLQPYFGTNSDEGQGHYGIRMKPDKTVFGETPLIGDLGNPREAAGALVREAITLGRDVMSAGGLMMGRAEERTERSADRLERELERAYARIAVLEAGQDRLRALENEFADKNLDRDLKRRENEMKMKVMESAGNKLIDYIPLLTSKLDTFMAQKFGTGEQISDEGKFYKRVTEVFLSKIRDEDRAKKVIAALELTNEDWTVIKGAGSKLQLEEKRAVMHEEAKALTRGAPIRNLRRLLPPASRSVPTIQNPNGPKPGSNGAANSQPEIVVTQVATGTNGS